MVISLEKILFDSDKRKGCVCCECKKPFAKYLVTTKDGTKMFCNRCIVNIK